MYNKTFFLKKQVQRYVFEPVSSRKIGLHMRIEKPTLPGDIENESILRVNISGVIFVFERVERE